VFVVCVVVIVAVAGWGLIETYNRDTMPSLEDLGRLWLSRLPVVAALVWLAVHASRESALAKRLEEDYGYKVAISKCFEGFRKQMADVGEAQKEGSPLATLCKDTLATISNPPGRIYAQHKLTTSPREAVKEILGGDRRDGTKSK
jgi:hypothetical protein